MRAATGLVRERRPDLKVEGPIQYDAAVDATVAEPKLPDSEVAGRATVFIFPDLNTGNNTYKAVQRSAGAVAIGPVLQGLRKPVNDLSRGCTVHGHRQHGRDHRDPGAGGRRLTGAQATHRPLKTRRNDAFEVSRRCRHETRRMTRGPCGDAPIQREAQPAGNSRLGRCPPTRRLRAAAPNRTCELPRSSMPSSPGPPWSMTTPVAVGYFDRRSQADAPPLLDQI